MAESDHLEGKPESTPLSRGVEWLRTALCVAIFVFGIWTVLTFDIDDAVSRSVFLGFTLLYAYLFFPARKKGRTALELVVDIVAAGLGLAVALYIAIDFVAVFDRAGAVNTLDLLVAGTAIVLILESTRRTAGIALPLLSIVFLLYPLVYGVWLPGLLRTSQFDLERVLTQQYLSLDGILGPALKVMIEYIFLFIVYGAFLQRFGVTEFFIDLAKSIAGNRKGGSAKVAVAASGLMGTVSGSAVANVVSTGVITIPTMRREGFKPAFAAAVEAAASTGGQIMPPIMGAAAFLMAEFARIPYSQIILHALIPSVLYFATIWTAVHFEAKRLNLTPNTDRLPRLWGVLKERGVAGIPLVLLTVLIVADYPLAESVLISIVVTVLVSSLSPALRPHLTIGNILAAIREGVDSSVSLFTASACAGIVIGVVSLTGLGLKISSVIIDVANGVALIGLALSALTCLVLGLGLPTQIVYLTLAILVAPGLVDMGITTAGAHMFIMYFGMMSMVTPPVCFAAFAAASLANASMMMTGVYAFRLALAGQLIPFLFAYNPGLLLIGTPVAIAADVLRTLACLAAAGTAFEIFRIAPYEADLHAPRLLLYLRRLLLGAGAAVLVHPSLETTLAGGALVVAGVVLAVYIGRLAPVTAGHPRESRA